MINFLLNFVTGIWLMLTVLMVGIMCFEVEEKKYDFRVNVVFAVAMMLITIAAIWRAIGW